MTTAHEKVDAIIAAHEHYTLAEAALRRMTIIAAAIIKYDGNYCTILSYGDWDEKSYWHVDCGAYTLLRPLGSTYEGEGWAEIDDSRGLQPYGCNGFGEFYALEAFYALDWISEDEMRAIYGKPKRRRIV